MNSAPPDPQLIEALRQVPAIPAVWVYLASSAVVVVVSALFTLVLKMRREQISLFKRLLEERDGRIAIQEERLRKHSECEHLQDRSRILESELAQVRSQLLAQTKDQLEAATRHARDVSAALHTNTEATRRLEHAVVSSMEATRAMHRDLIGQGR